jgi:subtilisin family serine protease
MILSTTLLFGMSGAVFGRAKEGEWLVRLRIAHPTLATVSAALQTPVTKIEKIDSDLVDGDLYKVYTPKAKADLDQKITESGLVASIQKNFIYKPALVRPKLSAQVQAKVDSDGVTDTDIVEADPDILPLPAPTTSRGNDPRQASQWGLQSTLATKAWEVERGNSEIVVAVIDTGVDYNHEDLRQNMWRNPGEIPDNGIDDDGNGYVDDLVGWDFANEDERPYDTMSNNRALGNPGHGTHCAGVVAAVGQNNLGISGIAPQVKVMALRFITEKGEGSTEAAIKSIRYAVQNGAKILSNSWGGEEPSEEDQELLKTLKWAQSQGALLVFAAGNGRDNIGYNNDTDSKPTIPASFDLDGILSVAAIDSKDRLGPFSNFGVKSVDLAAPGVKILSTVPKNGYEDTITLFGMPLGEWSGTSMATPHVAGAAALILSKYPDLSSLDLKKILMDSVRPVAKLTKKVGAGGTMDLAKALETASFIANP